MTTLRASGLAEELQVPQVVRDLSLEVTNGEVVGLLGPNGAGKTTAFYMIVGPGSLRCRPILLDERDLTAAPITGARSSGLGYLPQEASVFRKLSVEDNIWRSWRRAPTSTAPAREQRLEELLEELRIGHVRSTPRPVALGRRAPPRRDRAGAGGRAALHAAR